MKNVLRPRYEEFTETCNTHRQALRLRLHIWQRRQRGKQLAGVRVLRR